MTLQTLLLKLSKNKDISVECFVADDKCTVTIKEWYTFNTLAKIVINLNEKIDSSQFLPYVSTKKL